MTSTNSTPALTARRIGTVVDTAGGARVEILPPYRPALHGLEGFSHLVLVWWFSDTDTPADRSTVSVPSPYRLAPETLGVFATRAETRPTPVGFSVVSVLALDAEGIDVAFIDARPGTPVIDVKPYTPSIDRVSAPRLPAWCAHWPSDVESSGDFDWAAEFRF